MTIIAYILNGEKKYDLKNDLTATIAGQILTQILLEEIREKEGGTYGITASTGMIEFPKQRALMQIVYQTDPEKYEYLNSRVEQIIMDFVQNGTSEESLSKAKEYLQKTYQENLRENSYFGSCMREYLTTGVDQMTGYEDLLKGISLQDARRFVGDILSQNNVIKIVMNGVSK